MAGGKWGFLKGKIAERDPNEEPGYAERYVDIKRRLEATNATFEDLSKLLTLARERKEAITKNLSDAGLEVTVIERLVIEKLESDGIDSVTAAGYKLTPSVEPVFAKRDGAKLRAWARETDQEDLLTINSQTLSSLAKEHYLEHGEPMPGVELTNTFTKLSRTKQK